MVEQSKNDKIVFWGCFIALITTAFGFITRMFLLGEWGKEFNLNSVQLGSLAGMGIWPFAVSIIGFSLLIDKIGYKTAMVFSFLGYLIWSIMGVSAYFVSQNGDKETAYQLLYWGSLILALGNGTVEAFINPLVATMFNREKTKWLNILHAGWPGGLVVAGIIVILMDKIPAYTGEAVPWWIKVGIIVVPAVIFFVMLLPRKFPVSERVESGVSYREMLSEFGILGAIVVAVLVVLQLMQFFSQDGQVELSTNAKLTFVAIGAAIVLAFGLYTRALGRMFMLVMVLIMLPLATTEIGTDAWITSIMEGVAEGHFHSGWVLVYTSAIMMILRFFAGPIVHSLSPLGLLAMSAVLAIAGLLSLSMASGAMIFAAATLYGFGKTFFWPTSLGVVSEQMPKGGALTLNALGGIGMLAVGTLGAPYIGVLQANKEIEAVVASDAAKEVPGLVEGGALTATEEKPIYGTFNYTTIDNKALDAKLAALPADQQTQVAEELKQVRSRSNQKALANMAAFPAVMLLAYFGLILYFKARGGYKAEVLTGHAAEDEKFTGGVAGAVE